MTFGRSTRHVGASFSAATTVSGSAKPALGSHDSTTPEPRKDLLFGYWSPLKALKGLLFSFTWPSRHELVRLREIQEAPSWTAQAA